MLEKDKCELFSSGLKGAESAFGEVAEKWGVKETVYTFAGHMISRDKAARVVVLPEKELERGDISMEIVSKMMNRNYYKADKIRKVIQAIFHMVNSGHQIFAIGAIMENKTVKGGTGWGVELAKLFNRPLSVFDQGQEKWFTWKEGAWREGAPKIEYNTFVGTGTRNLTEAGRQAIERLFADSF